MPFITHLIAKKNLFIDFTKNTIKNFQPSYIEVFTQLLPQHCAICNCKLLLNSEHTFHINALCNICVTTLANIDTSCKKCNTPLSKESTLCGICIKQERHWEQCFAAFSYQEPISSLIHSLKYQNEKHLSKLLASFIIERIKSQSEPLPDLLIPIPMHSKKLAQRGYNQSVRLTKTLSTEMGIPWEIVITKERYTNPQATLKSHIRKRQLINSFKINTSIQKRIFHGKHISIIDDVVTTGATSSEVAKVLKQAGAKKVDVWCVART